MHHFSLPRAAAVLSLLAILALAHAPAAAASPGEPDTAAAAYLRARAAACISGWAGLRQLCVPGCRQLARERLIARGLLRSQAQLGHTLRASDCRVTVASVTTAADGTSATVNAQAITTLTWVSRGSRLDSEASGIDHTITMRLVGGRWLVAADTYLDDLVPRCLETAGAAQTSVREAAARLETRSRAADPCLFAESAATPERTAGPGSAGDIDPIHARPSAMVPARAMLGYRAILTYDRDAAKAYADKYALSYNPTYISFSADCANFGSQTMFAGGYPKSLGGYEEGWWYDKKATSSPGDDTWSHSWIAVSRQMAYWNDRYTDVVTSIGECARGDFVYYD